MINFKNNDIIDYSAEELDDNNFYLFVLGYLTHRISSLNLAEKVRVDYECTQSGFFVELRLADNKDISLVFGNNTGEFGCTTWLEDNECIHSRELGQSSTISELITFLNEMLAKFISSI